MRTKRTSTFLLILLFLKAETAVCLSDGSASSKECLECHSAADLVPRGWYHNIHFSNRLGIVAECNDCHVINSPDKAVNISADIHDSLRKPNENCNSCHSNLTNEAMSPAAKKAHRANVKKAIVTLLPGQTIKLFEEQVKDAH